MKAKKMQKIKCPVCGYQMPILFVEGASCKDIYVKCKGRNCKKVFEINNDLLKFDKEENNS